jgi:hypothetical protein
MGDIVTDSPTFTGTVTWPDLTDEALDRAVTAWFQTAYSDALNDDVAAEWRERMRAAITALRGGA